MVYNIEIKDEVKDKLNKLLTTLQKQNTLSHKKQKSKDTSKYYEV